MAKIRILNILMAASMLLATSFQCLGQCDAQVYAYIEKYKATALKFERDYGIPATITLAQAILESGAGTSKLSRRSNNHFGIKATGWKGRVYKAKDDDPGLSSFRCYNSPEESFRDYARLLSNSSNYRRLFSINIYDYRGGARGLKACNYATNPKYAEALIMRIERYKLYAINGGVKLKDRGVQEIPKYVERQKTIWEEYEVIEEEEITEEEAIIIEALRNYVVEINDVPCAVILPGETLSSISRKYDISQEKLLAYNEISSPRQAEEGDIIFLDKKKKKYNGAQDFYEVKGGETLYEISQRFGIRLTNLAKMNRMNEYCVLDKGTKIFLK